MTSAGRMPVLFATKAELVARALRTDILEGVVLPGEQLLQDEIATRLGVSSTPVREAFGILEAEGLVVRRPHRGVVVNRASFRDVALIYKVRLQLEPIAAREIAMGPDRSAIAAIAATVKSADRALAAGETTALRGALMAFHQAVAGGIGSKMMADILHRLIARSAFFVPDVAPPRMEQAHREHQRLLALLEAGDADAAAALLSRHLELTFRADAVASASVDGPERLRGVVVPLRGGQES